MKIIQKILILLFVFYYIYPQALDVFGFSFIVPSAIIGLGMYCYHKLPFKEAIYVVLSLLGLIFIFHTSGYINNFYDSFAIGYLRSQIAWFFSAYLIIYFIFKIHNRPSANVAIGYVIAAIMLQCVITFAMYMNPNVNDFFFSLQMEGAYSDEVRDMVEGERLIGYGISFFGAGLVCGYALILTTYIFAKERMGKYQLWGLALVFCFIFYIGLFSARTTIIGLGTGLCMLFFLNILDYRSTKKQTFSFIFILATLIPIGYFLAFIYFPTFTDWAFELFDNFIEKGSIETQSSNALSYMAMVPEDFKTFIIGNGSMQFWGNDMGYARLVFYSGVIGTFAYFLYQIYIGSLCMTRDKALNVLICSIIIYSFVLNIKGLTDLNAILYLFFFYFMFHKYYVYYPQLVFRQKLLTQNKIQ